MSTASVVSSLPRAADTPLVANELNPSAFSAYTSEDSDPEEDPTLNFVTLPPPNLPISSASKVTIDSQPAGLAEPAPIRGNLHKEKKLPVKGTHKRYFDLTRGYLSWAKTEQYFEGRRGVREVDLGLCVISYNEKRRLIAIDSDSAVHRLKFKEAQVYQRWVTSIKEHKRFRDKVEQTCKNARATRELVNDSRESSPPLPQLSSGKGNQMATLETLVKEISGLAEALRATRRSSSSTTIDAPGEQKESDGHDEVDHVGASGAQLDERKVASIQNLNLESSPSMLSRDGQIRTSNKYLKYLPLVHRKSKRSERTSGQEFSSSADKFVATAMQLSQSANTLLAKLKEQQAPDSPVTIRDSRALKTEINRLTNENRQLMKSKQLLMTIQDLVQEDSDLRRERLLRHKTIYHSFSRSTDGYRLNSSSSSNGSTCFQDALGSAQSLSSDSSVGSELEADAVMATGTISRQRSDKRRQPDKRISLKGMDKAYMHQLTLKHRRQSEAYSAASRNVDGRRTVLPCARPDCNNFSMLNLLYKNIGRDLSKIRLPVTMNEPLSALQRLCEEMEYSNLLDAAVLDDDPAMRMVHVAAFAVSAYSSSYCRASTKPFNPLLGETFEHERPELGWHFIAEQVSHHPPVAVCHCESTKWTFEQQLGLKNKFWGKSLEASALGGIRVTFTGRGETYFWRKVTTCIYNLTSPPSKRSIEHYGDMEIKCAATDLVCRLRFHKAKADSKPYLVSGIVENVQHQDILAVYGVWNDAFYLGDPAEPNDSSCLWRMKPMPKQYELFYGFTEFAVQLNEEVDTVEVSRGSVPDTDSRLRPDQRALELGNVELAEEEKQRLEEAQRRRQQSNSKVSPRWFAPAKEQGETALDFRFTGEYWRVKKASGFIRPTNQRIF